MLSHCSPDRGDVNCSTYLRQSDLHVLIFPPPPGSGGAGVASAAPPGGAPLVKSAMHARQTRGGLALMTLRRPFARQKRASCLCRGSIRHRRDEGLSGHERQQRDSYRQSDQAHEPDDRPPRDHGQQQRDGGGKSSLAEIAGEIC